MIDCTNEKYIHNCFSEYEIYFNFALYWIKEHTGQILEPRFLKWKDIGMLDPDDLAIIKKYKAKKYSYLARHSHIRMEMQEGKRLREDSVDRECD